MHFKLFFVLLPLLLLSPLLSNNKVLLTPEYKEVIVQSQAIEWPMAGANNQRTSFISTTGFSTPKNPAWHVRFNDAYIPNQAHIITVDRGTDSRVLVPTSKGLYALHPDTGSQIWFYPTSQPLGNSPTVSGDVAYLPVLDKTIHAINIKNGNKIWQTDKAEGGFTTNPIVANGLVYVGNLDGYLYAFSQSNGSLSWYYGTNASIYMSPTLNNTGSILYIVSNDMYAYALNSSSGHLLAKSSRIYGDQFTSFWPVYNDKYNLLLIGKAMLWPPSGVNGLIKYQRHTATYNGQPLLYPKDSLEDATTIDGSRFRGWLNEDPQRKSLIALDGTTLSERETPPFLWWGNQPSQRYPPAVDNIGTVWSLTPWHDGSYFGAGRYAGWTPGTTNLIPKPAATSGTESADEPEAIAIFGDAIYHNDGGDGVDKGGVAPLTSNVDKASWHINKLWGWFGDFWEPWSKFTYGNTPYLDDPSNPSWGSRIGTHGHQNPPVPLKDKIYFFRSNTVFCLKQ